MSATLATLHSKEVRLDHGGNFGGNVKRAASPFSPGTSLCHLPYLQLGLRWLWLPGRWRLVPEETADTSFQLPMSLQHPVGRLKSLISSVGLLFPSPYFYQKMLSRHQWDELFAAFQSINGEWQFYKISSRYRQLSSASHMAMAEAQTGSKVSDSEQAGGGTASDHPSPQFLTSKDHDLGGKEEVIFQCYWEEWRQTAVGISQYHTKNTLHDQE